MRVLAELTIIEGIQNQSNDFRNQFVAPDRHIHSTLPPLPRHLWDG
jgi:hypothetical protein